MLICSLLSCQEDRPHGNQYKLPELTPNNFLIGNLNENRSSYRVSYYDINIDFDIENKSLKDQVAQLENENSKNNKDNQIRKLYGDWKENFFNETIPRAFQPISKEYGVYAAVDLMTSKNLVYRENIEVTELFIKEINNLLEENKNNYKCYIANDNSNGQVAVSYTHLRAHETPEQRGWGGGGG